MKTSSLPLVSFETRFEAKLSKTKKRPPAEIAAGYVSLFACAPDESTLTRVVVWIWRSPVDRQQERENVRLGRE